AGVGGEGEGGGMQEDSCERGLSPHNRDSSKRAPSPPLPHPNSGLPEFDTLSGRSRIRPTSVGAGSRPSLLLVLASILTPPLPRSLRPAPPTPAGSSRRTPPRGGTTR